jgi:hypothetical protein
MLFRMRHKSDENTPPIMGSLIDPLIEINFLFGIESIE